MCRYLYTYIHYYLCVFVCVSAIGRYAVRACIYIYVCGGGGESMLCLVEEVVRGVRKYFIEHNNGTIAYSCLHTSFCLFCMCLVRACVSYICV